MDSMSFQNINLESEVEIPIGNHVGAFGVYRRYDRHKGVDLYCPVNTEVVAIEEGVVIDIRWFTGEKAGFPWWYNTQAITVKGKSGNLVYGEIEANKFVKLGDKVKECDNLGHVLRVLKKDKGRPISMLHFAMHNHGVLSTEQWTRGGEQPVGCIDPTNFLLRIAFPS